MAGNEVGNGKDNCIVEAVALRATGQTWSFARRGTFLREDVRVNFFCFTKQYVSFSEEDGEITPRRVMNYVLYIYKGFTRLG